jgi:hypothetical protein
MQVAKKLAAKLALGDVGCLEEERRVRRSLEFAERIGLREDDRTHTERRGRRTIPPVIDKTSRADVRASAADEITGRTGAEMIAEEN